MNRSIIIRPEAEDDLAKASAWYEGQRKGLGTEFIVAYDAVIERMRRVPESFPEGYAGIHRALFRRFPYAVYSSSGPNLSCSR